MKTASGELKIERAKRKDIKELVDLIYITEPYPEEEWGFGTEKQRKKNLKKLLGTKNNRFSIDNIIVARKEKELVGMLLFLEGNKINELTKNSERFVIKEQEGWLNKLGLIYSGIKGKILYKECEEDEFYISNLAIKTKYRGNGYSEIILEKAYEIAKNKGYHKASLVAKNDALIKFYQRIGYTLMNQRIRRMIISL